MSNWLKNIAIWTEGSKAYVSVPFTWLLPSAFSRCVALRAAGYDVYAGGPAVSLMPNILSDVANIDGKVNALHHHNPQATFTSRGCIRRCKFCAVPHIEGDLTELESWPVKPIVCDNNLLACSQRHFDRVIDKLKCIENIDFNQGLDARLLNGHHLDRLAELNIEMLRFSWDFIGEENVVMSAIERCLEAGFPKSKIRVYVLFGFHDTPEDTLYRFQTLRNMGILPNPQWYQPIEKSEYGDPLVKDSYVEPPWTKLQLKRFRRYWSRLIYFGNLPFKEFQG